MYKKRSARSRLRGRRTCGYGQKFKHRGKGSKGGKGMAGTGKRAGQKVTWRLKYWPDYFGKTGFKSRQKKMLAINVGEINDRINSFVNKKKAIKEKDTYKIELKGYKILSTGKVDKKLFIKAESFSKKAEEKIVKAGGVAEKLNQ
jgi:large subunit ribosomal protein L15